MASFLQGHRRCAFLTLSKELWAQKRLLGKSSSSHRCKDASQSRQSSHEEGRALCAPDGQPWAERTLDGTCFPLRNPSRSSLPGQGVPGRPLQVPLGRGRLASVSAVLQQTLPLEQALYLERWKQRMLLKLGKEGFAEYTENLFEQGKLFHAALENLLLNEEISLKGQEEGSSVFGFLASIKHVLQDVTGVRVLESAVQHESLQYRGIVDCVAEYRGTLCVIEWKTSEKSKPFLKNTFDSPLQLAAYMGAINHDENYNFQVGCGLLVIAYKDGSPAHPHYIDTELCSQYWNKWLFRLKEYKEKEKRSATH